MAYRFTARAVPRVFAGGSARSYEARAGSFTIVAWPDGTSRFGAPTEIAWLTDTDRLPDVVNLPYLCISRRVRDLIERFEPGRHHFYPVRVTLRSGASEDRFLLHVTRKFDAVSAEHSNWIKASGVLWQSPPAREKRLVFDRRLIGDAHLWHNEGLRSEMNFIASDALAEAAQAAGITGLLLDRFDQTDAEGRYTPSPRPEQVYVVSEQTRLRPSGHVPLTITVALLDGNPKAIRLADDSVAAPMALASAVRLGRRLDPANVPTRVRYYQNAKGTAPDLFSYGDVPLTVSERFRELIEAFEPGLHQFLPVAFEDKKGNVTHRRFFLVLQAVLDTGSREHSTMLSDPPWFNPGHQQGRVRISRREIAGRHAWRDRWLPGNLFVSDAMARIIEERGWPHLSFGEYEVVD